MTPNINTQVVAAYETSGLTPEEISDSLDLDLLAVKSTLTMESSKYRKATKEDVTDDELDEFFGIVKDLARSSAVKVNHPTVTYKAATFLINEKKGRNDPRAALRALQGSGISITFINDRLEGMKQAKARTQALQQKSLELLPA